MGEETKVSATVSAATRDRLDRFAPSRGLDRNDVVAQAHREEGLIPTRIVLEASSFDRLIESREQPSKPTRALKALMRSARRHAPTVRPTDSSR
jgi:uncharacterized protein (DUF1778 family)